MDPLYSVLASQLPVDLKANGEVSRMRSHKGNMPSLPQTKYCPLCPAKFTRTTHLNRHLRSHTNERLHRCNICHAEFTRSDLLTRHKRTCGDSVNANRSRRKSCQACAESKVKCNLQYPCSKCSSRGRECIFINDPEASRLKKNAAKRKLSLSTSSTSGSTSPTSASAPASVLPDSMTSSPMDFPSVFPSFNPTTPVSSHSLLPSTAGIYDMPSLVSPGSSSTSSSLSSPRSEFFDNQADISGAFDMTFDTFALDSHLNRAFSSNLFDSFLDHSMSSCTPTQPGSLQDFSWLEGSELYPAFGDDQFTFPQPHGYDDQGFTTDFAAFTSTNSSLNSSPRTSTHQTSVIDPGPSPFYEAPSFAAASQGPTTADFNLYLSLFFSTFCTQVPIVHPATWKMEDKPLILVRAMQACGALFVKTPTAVAFVDETLSSTRDALIQEFAKTSSDPREQNHLILTVVLLQTIGLFHQKADQRISSNVYHGMLVMMIRRTGFITRVGAWTPPDLDDAQSLDSAWREWANYETIKRVLFLAYIHDCCHCMYFSIPPSFQPAEMDMCLPCDNALWDAADAREWYGLVQAPSPYGTGSSRISGFSMKRALGVLNETRFSTVSVSLNPFAHFILIHTILRNLYASHAESPTPDSIPTRTATDEALPGEERDNAFAIQYSLHNWLQMWLNSPESMQVEKSREEPPFICNALPYYWLAQVSLLAIQDGTAIFGGKSSDASTEGRFRLMKKWLDHIRTFLRSGNQIPTHLWDELMKIRTQMSFENAQAGEDHPTGLLAFFPGN
ncbi:Zinc finger protein klf1 [Hypsizygus marmoreus]|uniref:Zinc finger protein klf1 n=1 Tax=Hypsizygus marmoreus TaxID=39966 RepID=A0A369J6X1_HYPMA|nr:Zinc finger protein klf1 [Hypsizygus marmoreus]